MIPRTDKWCLKEVVETFHCSSIASPFFENAWKQISLTCVFWRVICLFFSLQINISVALQTLCHRQMLTCLSFCPAAERKSLSIGSGSPTPYLFLIRSSKKLLNSQLALKWQGRGSATRLPARCQVRVLTLWFQEDAQKTYCTAIVNISNNI